MLAELEQLARRLTAANYAFADAGTAVARYANVHADAGARAAVALSMWQEAAPISAAGRGMVVGAAAPADVEAADAAMARAAALLNAARDELEVAARTMAVALEEAQEGHPKDPGIFSMARRFVTSLTIGVAEGVWGAGGGTVELASQLGTLAYEINPARAYYDPEGYQAASDALWGGVAQAARNPGALGKALIDYEMWQEDPARALGRLAPDIVAIVATGVAVGAAAKARSAGRIRSAGVTVHGPRGSASRSADAARAGRAVDDLGLDLGSAAGQGALGQLMVPLGHVDEWVPVRLADGQLIAITRGSSPVMTPIIGELPTDARAFFERLQYPPERVELPEGADSNPLHRPKVLIVQVQGGELDAGQAVARANSQFGHGRIRDNLNG